MFMSLSKPFLAEGMKQNLTEFCGHILTKYYFRFGHFEVETMRLTLLLETNQQMPPAHFT